MATTTWCSSLLEYRHVTEAMGMLALCLLKVFFASSPSGAWR